MASSKTAETELKLETELEISGGPLHRQARGTRPPEEAQHTSPHLAQRPKLGA